MNCTKCGANLTPGSKFCEVCGAKVEENGAETNNNAQSPFMQNRQVNQTQLDNYNVHVTGFSSERIRKWFFGNNLGILIVLMILIGLFLLMLGSAVRDTEMSMAGIMILLGGIGIIVYAAMQKTDGLDEVNRAWVTYTNILAQRGIEKLNLIQEEVSLVDPIVIVGKGERPGETSEVSTSRQDLVSQGIVNLANNSINKKGQIPVEGYKRDEYGNFHSMLLQVSVYMFSDKQVFSYVGNIDTSTGKIYRERTTEVFLKDIEGVKFEQEVLLSYSQIIESFVLYLSGCKLRSSIMLESNDMSVIENQLAGMRNLIRDKKDSE